jgi:3-methyl-2-oxobutanoate hydroxymethyltransferase
VSKVTIWGLHKKKQRGEKITALTVYDYPFARLADEAQIDCLLVSDVLGQVGLGYETTVPVTLDQMVHHTQAVLRGASRALVIAKMPFLCGAGDFPRALESAERLIKEAGARGLEVEGGGEIVPVVSRLVEAGIPVMPHIGATVQTYLRTGVFGTQAKNAADAGALLELAGKLEAAGAFAVMLECVPAEVAQAMSTHLKIPVIGIGSGPHCDGQLLVSQDLLGLFDRFVPKFVKVYRQLGREVLEGFRQFREEVESETFPGSGHSTPMGEAQLSALTRLLGQKEG